MQMFRRVFKPAMTAIVVLDREYRDALKSPPTKRDDQWIISL